MHAATADFTEHYAAPELVLARSNDGDVVVHPAQVQPRAGQALPGMYGRVQPVCVCERGGTPLLVDSVVGVSPPCTSMT